MNYIVIWKDAPGQQVSTVVDASDQPVLRDRDYLSAQNIPVVHDGGMVITILKNADGRKVAIEPELARSTLGWDL